ncbi:L,D-transpeptidase [Methylobacterium terrae]
MRRLGRFLPALLLCGAGHAALVGAAQAMNADESPTGWWAPSLRDCADPASPRVFEIRLRPAAEARLEAHDLRCRIDRVSDTAIGYRLHMRCYHSAEDLRADARAQARQIVVDAIGPVTMRADGQRVYRCRSRPAASAAAPAAIAAGEAPATVPALPLPDAPMRLAALPSGAPPVAPAPGPGASPALAAIPALAANPAPAASPVPLPGLAAVPGPALVPGLAAPPDPAPDAPTRMAALPAEPLPASPAPAPIAPSPPPVGLAVRRGKVVGYPGAQAPGTIVVDTAARLLYLVRGDGTAVRYRVAVGRPGTTWKGTETVTAKQEWPQWTPTPEMRRSRPGLPRHVAGGPRNPLGARALYLGSSLYRIHGTTDPTSIGRAASAGCFRMLNEDVIELYRFVPVGTKVQVI